ncbi:MAG: glycoside hydrolase family 15 protein [Anaerolineae bacterium]|nr:glycoside hydrolase family 15 protein [Anaerolineae bacterium]
MPRDIPLGNGSLLVNFDQQYHLRDLYWPYVGQENHTHGHACRMGVWVNGALSWVHDPPWVRTLAYEHDTLVSQVTLYSPGHSLRIACHDAVDFHENLYLRQIIVDNYYEHPREVRLFFTHDLHIGGSMVGDSAYYEPERRAVFHYKGHRWFMIVAARYEGEALRIGLDQWAVGKTEMLGREGTWRDAEDGVLSGNAVEQGTVDSTVALHLTVPGRGQAVGWYWIAVGNEFREVTRINRTVREKGPQAFLDRTRDYWRLWLTKEDQDLCDLSNLTCSLVRRSLLILRTQIDNHGAILAANDFDIAHYGRDTYSYMWPRDGALVVATLIEAGYSMLARRFFEFCHGAITDEGYLLHKYAPDGALASSWHGWYVDGQKALPVQEDETALVVWALWRHFATFRDVEFIKAHYRGLVVRAGSWLAAYRDQTSGLPLPSWDLWEERRGVHAWTVGATWAGLEAAARFADAFGEHALAQTYRVAAGQIRAGAEEYLWQPDLNRFARTIRRNGEGWDVDATIDASLVGLWAFEPTPGEAGMFAVDDPRIVATMQAVRDRLSVRTPVGGLARYEDDYYHQISQDVEAIPGNPWFICTLWLAEWLVETAAQAEDLDQARDLLEWASRHALPSGVMAEQVHPHSGEPLSVSPLTWSHATLVSVAHAYAERRRSMQLEAKRDL